MLNSMFMCAAINTDRCPIGSCVCAPNRLQMPSPRKTKSGPNAPPPAAKTCRAKVSSSTVAKLNVKSKPVSAVSAKSTSSQASVDSVGIGATTIRQPPPDAHLRFRLMPEGNGTNVPSNQYVFDCMVFVIICKQHNTVVLTNPSDWSRMYSYFPFIPLQEAFTWSRMAHDGLAIIFGKSDTSGDADSIHLPEHNTSWLNIQRVQLPRSTKFCTRITQLVTLLTPEDSSEFKCCQDNQRIRWLKLADVTQRGSVNNLWSDEVVTTCETMRPEGRINLSEIDVKACLPTTEAEARLLQHINWTEKLVGELLEDYLRHMYPALSMTVHSFRCFLQKYSLNSKNDIDRLFKAFATGGELVSFSQLMIGLACMDPEAANDLDARAKFIFCYYNTDNTGVLSSSQAIELMLDLEPKSNESKVKSKVQNLMKSFSSSNGTLSLAEFTDALRCENDFPNADRLLRLEKSYFVAKKCKLTNLRGSYQNEETSKSSSSKTQSKSPAQEGICSAHAIKKYDYSLHAVTLDSTGRCVDPRIINEHWVTEWDDLEMTRNRFSMETVFRNTSVMNTFLDLVRDFKEQQMDQPECRGLLTAEDDWEMLHAYVEMLTQQVQAIVSNEPKLLRLTSPLIVIGDLQGGLRELFHYESHLFRMAPVSGHMLLFLGNYSGPTFSYGFECIIYLFALKIKMPNKIYLLRGRNEIRSFNKSHLKGELQEKYGEDYGEKIWESINRVFDCLPMVSVVDESILCTHAGIPELSPDRTLVRTIQTEFSSKTNIRDPKEEMPIGYELMVNVPVRYAHEKDEETATNQKGFAISKTGLYRYFSRKAFEAFMKTNSFDYLIRSHNPCDDGYALCFETRCLTIYSCRRSNSSPMSYTGVVLVNDSKRKIRVVRFETAAMSLSNKKTRA